MKNFNKIILSLGSNIGHKKSNLETAINEINEFSTIKKISSIYESDPILLKDQDNFFNLVLEIDYKKTVIELLETTKDIERRMGRNPSSGSSVVVMEKYHPYFRASKSLKMKVK